MYFQLYVLTDHYLEDMVRQFPFLAREGFKPGDGPITKSEEKAAIENLKKAMFLMDYSHEKWGNRPLAKLTHDIAMEIEDKQSGR